MGKKGGWFAAVKKALSPDSKKGSKSKKTWLAKPKSLDPVGSSGGIAKTIPVPPPPPAPHHREDVKLTEAENEQSKHAYSVALATAVAAEAAVAAAHAAAEVVRLTTVNRFSGKSKEEIAAIKIQTAFRGYLSRRALRALRGLVRLKTLIQGQSVKRQATTTLRCMQTLARVQSQIRARRIRMSEENQARQRQIQQKQENEHDKMRASMGGDWDLSVKSKAEIEAKLQYKQEAARRRERALAYAFSHQQTWKNSSKSSNPTFMDPNNPHWGWSWLERWMAARPWESRSTIDNSEQASVKSTATTNRPMSGAEINKAYSRHSINYNNKPSPPASKPNRPPSRQSPSTPPSRAPSSSSVARKTKQASPSGSGWGGDEDSRSLFSVQSELYRRHSVAGSSVKDDDSLASTPSVPSYMTPTKAATARSRVPSPLGAEHDGSGEKRTLNSAKKRLSFRGSPSPAASRRHSFPPKVDFSTIKDNGMLKKERLANGGRWAPHEV